MDCCHSGRMIRDPRHVQAAVRKNLPVIYYHDVARHIQSLRDSGRLRKCAPLTDNPHAVRIAAAAPWESAYEYENVSGMRVGALTEALVRVIEETDCDQVTWKTAMLRVQELVNVTFPQQHPRVEGPNTRNLFSLHRQDTYAFLIKEEGQNIARIGAGKIAGVREGNTYAVMPPGTECVDLQRQIATATVTHISGFDSIANLTWERGASGYLREGTLAFLAREALYKWPISVTANIAALQKQVDQSKLIRCSDDGETLPLVEIRQQEGKLTVNHRHGLEIFSQRFYGKEPSSATYKAAVDIANQVARAQHLLSQSCHTPEEHLQHDLEIKLGLVEDDHYGRIIDATGEDSITENSNIFMSLRNPDGHVTVYISVFEVEINGQINAVTENPDGIDLPPGQSHTIGIHKKLQVKWPHNISNAHAVVDTLVLIISDYPVNLQFLKSSEIVPRRATNNQSSLESDLLLGMSGDIPHWDSLPWSR